MTTKLFNGNPHRLIIPSIPINQCSFLSSSPGFNKVGPRLYHKSAEGDVPQCRKTSLVVDSGRRTAEQEVKFVTGFQWRPSVIKLFFFVTIKKFT